jgi:ribosome biogenesis GTPase
MKKKDKFRAKGQELKLKNIKVDDIDDIYHFETSQFKKEKATKTLTTRGKQTYKSNLNLTKSRVYELGANYSCKVKIDGEFRNSIVSGRLKFLAHSTKNPICVGDYVSVDITDPQNLRIEEIMERKNILTRYIVEVKREMLLASNIDQMVITTSAREPNFNANIVDRYICLAEMLDIYPIICINKIDLIDGHDDIKIECDYYSKMGYQIVYISARTSEGLDELKDLLINKDTIFTGSSGTGKSSIINALQPDLNLRTGDISYKHNRGMHTTTSARLVEWDFGGHLIDTPGVKSLHLRETDVEFLPYSFPGFYKYFDLCAFKNCTHMPHEDSCAIIERIGTIIPKNRYENYKYIWKNPC